MTTETNNKNMIKFTLTTDRLEEEEEEDAQYKSVCDSCDLVLGIDVHIFCLEKDGEEITVCQWCGEDLMADGWVDSDVLAEREYYAHIGKPVPGGDDEAE